MDAKTDEIACINPQSWSVTVPAENLDLTETKLSDLAGLQAWKKFGHASDIHIMITNQSPTQKLSGEKLKPWNNPCLSVLTCYVKLLLHSSLVPFSLVISVPKSWKTVIFCTRMSLQTESSAKQMTHCKQIAPEGHGHWWRQSIMDYIIPKWCPKSGGKHCGTLWLKGDKKHEWICVGREHGSLFINIEKLTKTVARFPIYYMKLHHLKHPVLKQKSLQCLAYADM